MTEKKDNPKISIVLPTYNGERFLRDAINSIIMQTEEDFELIIVNDCSTDSTKTIAEEFSNHDARIIVITNKTNMKLPASLNIGFSKARGEYFTWTSDDNLCKPNWLAVLSTYLDNNPNADMVAGDMDRINEDGSIYSRLCKFYPYRNALQLAYECNIGAAFMYRRSIAEKVGTYDDSMFCAEDYDYWCRMALVGQIDFTEDNVYQYRRHKSSLSSTKKQLVKEHTRQIQQKYKKGFIQKYQLTRKQKQKLEWLIKEYHFYPSHILFFIKKTYFHWTASLFWFWNKDLRKKHRRRGKTTF